MDRSDWGYQEFTFSMRISKETRRKIQENSKRNGFSNMSAYVVSLIDADDATWKKPIDSEKDAKIALMDEQAKLSAALGNKARFLLELSFKIYYLKFKSSNGTDFKKYCEEKEMLIERYASGNYGTFYLYPSKTSQVAYLVNELRDYLLRQNSVLYVDKKPVPISSNDLIFYTSWLKLKIQAMSETITIKSAIAETESSQLVEQSIPEIPKEPDSPVVQLPGESSQDNPEEQEESDVIEQDEDFDASGLRE